MAEAKRDANYIPTLLAVSNVDGTTPVPLYADPVTHRLLVSVSSDLGDLGDVTITSEAQGDILYFNGTAWVNLAPGTAGNVLQTGGAGANPSWVSASGGGNVSKVGTPADNQIGVWTGDGTIEGTAGLTYNGSNFLLTGDIGATGTRITKGWFTDLQVTNAISGSITGNSATATALAVARTIGGVSFDGTANITVSSATGGFTVSGGNLAIGTNSITMSGSIGVTGTRVTKGWFTDLECTNAIAGSVTGNAGTVTNATLTTALTVNTGTLTLTANVANNSVLTIGAGAVSVSGSNTGDEPDASSTVAGIVELAIASEIDTGTDSTRAIPIDQFVASKRNIRWLVFNLVEAGTNCAAATNIAGDFVSPIAGTILQSDTTPFYLYATNSTAGTTGNMVVDINIGGTSIMTTNKLSFDSTEKTTTTSTTPPDLTTTTLAVGDIITIDIDSVHTTAAKGLTVYIAIRE